MDIVALFDEAWDLKRENTHERSEEMFKNLISHGFVAFEEFFKDLLKDEYDDDLFYVIQKVLTYLIYADGDCLQGEYDAYVKYCDWAGFQACTVSELEQLYDDIDYDGLTDDLDVIIEYRDRIPEDDYRALVLGLCLFCFMGDDEIDEDEYAIVSFFLQQPEDYAPDWETFKRDWLRD